jgi:hypothetical protein
VTTGTPAACTTAKGAAELIAVSFAANALAVAMALLTAAEDGGCTLPPPPPPPQPAMATTTEQAMPHRTINCFIFSPSVAL